MMTPPHPDGAPGPLPLSGTEEVRINTAARRRLVWLLLGYILLYLTVASLLAHRAIDIVIAKGTAFEAGDLVVLGFSYTLLFNLLTTLPLLMVVGYRGLQGAMVMAQVRSSLTLCGLPLERVNTKMWEYRERNSFHAFLLPIGVTLCFLIILWGSVLFPHGVSGLMDHLEIDGRLYISLNLVLQRVASEALVENWVFLGAYFYALTTMVRRWMQSDLTTNVLWKLNARFAITILIGLLFAALFTADGGLHGKPEAWVLSLAFLTGLVPEVFLRWIAQQAKHLVGGGNAGSGLFQPSELQKKITGMSFWQADRLSEEGIDSIQDLAMKEIPELLIRTRFDPALLFSWVDRALLWNQAGDQTPWLQRAHLRSASQLVLRAAHGSDQQAGIDAVLVSLEDARDRAQQQTMTQAVEQQLSKDLLNIDQSQPVPLSRAMLENILSGLQYGPNLHYVCNYWREVGGAASAFPQ